MGPLLYGELVGWYRLIDPPEDHAEEAAHYGELLAGAASGAVETLLELGAGAGHNALHLKRRLRCTLTDLSEGMLGLSRALNPECEHLPGDMRTLRLGRTFDAVLVHDAVMYMTTREDLAAAARTAFLHTRPGGVALFAPDYVRDTFREATRLEGSDGRGEHAGRALRCLTWDWDPDPADDQFVADFAFLLREGQATRAVHDRHVCGLFSRQVWREILAGAGFEIEAITRAAEEEGHGEELFLCRRP
jgi:SAM-dependent methyltransferase